MADETNQEAFDRGVGVGRIEQRLAGYDDHFRLINGSIAKTATELHTLGMQVQRLADQAVADGQTRVSTAEAVEKARRDAAAAVEAERRARVDRSDTSWSPVQRLAVVLGAVGALVAVVIGLRALL